MAAGGGGRAPIIITITTIIITTTIIRARTERRGVGSLFARRGPQLSEDFGSAVRVGMADERAVDRHEPKPLDLALGSIRSKESRVGGSGSTAAKAWRAEISRSSIPMLAIRSQSRDRGRYGSLGC